MPYGITSTGFSAKRLADIQTEIEDAFRSAFGAGINLDPLSPLGQMIGIVAERESLIWELAEDVYNSQYPDSASGASLDNVASISNIIRLAATYSTVTARITGANGTFIPIGFIASVDGAPSARFVTIESGTITVGYIDLAFRAESTGPVQAPAGSLTVIETPQTGVDSITNSLDAALGRNTETDAELKQRRAELLQRSGTATIEGIRRHVLNVVDVLQCTVIENSTGIFDSDGRPPKCFEAVVSGGDDTEIATAIFEAKAAGIETHGDITEVIVDSQGISHDIEFSRPTDKDIWLIINITPNTDPNEGDLYPASGDQDIEDALLAYGETFTMGQDVINNQMYTPINTVPGVIGIEVLAGFSNPPTSSANLTLAADELAIFDSTRIVVNS